MSSTVFYHPCNSIIATAAAYIVCPAIFGVQRLKFVAEMISFFGKKKYDYSFNDRKNEKKIGVYVTFKNYIGTDPTEKNYATDIARPESMDKYNALDDTKKGFIDALQHKSPTQIKLMLVGQALRGIIEVIVGLVPSIIFGLVVLLKDFICSKPSSHSNFAQNYLHLTKFNIGGEDTLIEIKTWQTTVQTHLDAEHLKEGNK